MSARRTLPLAAAVLALAGASLMSHAAAAETTFTVSVPRPSSHLLEIEMTVSPFERPVESFDLVLPVWTPGSYFVRDYARNLERVAASGPDGIPLDLEKVEKSRWRVRPGRPSRGAFTVRYSVYANELTVRTSHVDATHAYGNGPSLFFYVEGRKDEPQALRFVLPEGWRASIALPEGGGVFHARDYDELVDSPFECGTHRLLEFSVRGVPHAVAIWGAGNEDPGGLVRDLGRIVEAAAAVFGSLPYDRYLFLVHLAAGARGGLEHRASQSVGVEPFRFRPEKAYREVLALLAHELFHAWNVKRIRPRPLGPFDYTREVYTREVYTKDLWAMEGITSYYEWLLLVRAGLAEPKQAFEEWARMLKEHRETPGSGVQSAEMASFDAWIRYYRPDENSPNVSEGYYRRGALIGLALDLALRSATAGRSSLDAVLAHLYAEYGARREGYPDGAYEEHVGSVSGVDVSSFFSRYVRGVETPPIEELLAPFGLALKEKPEKDDGDEEAEGTDDSARAPVEKRRADFGWKTRAENGRVSVAEVYRGRPADEAGVNAGDELVAADSVKVDDGELKRIGRDGSPGSTVRLHVFRRGRLLEIPLRLGERRAFRYEVEAFPDAPEAARRLRTAWLGRELPERPAASRPREDAPSAK